METYSHNHPELSAAPTRPALDPLWRTAAVAHMVKSGEQNVGSHKVLAAPMIVDIRALFDKIPPQRAADAALYAGMPFWVVRMAFAGYSVHRHLRVGKVSGGLIAPAAGIVAGDTIAMLRGGSIHGGRSRRATGDPASEAPRHRIRRRLVGDHRRAPSGVRAPIYEAISEGEYHPSAWR